MGDEEAVPVAPEPVPTTRPGLTTFVGAVAVLGALAVIASAGMIQERPSSIALISAVAILALGNLPIVHVRHGDQTHTFNWSEASIVAGLVLLPAWWLPIVGVVVTAAHYGVQRRPPMKVAFNALSFGVAGFLATAVHLVVSDHLPTSAEWMALGLACAVYFVWNTATVAVVVALSRGVPVAQVAGSGLILAALFAVANSSVAILIAIAATKEPLVLVAVPPVIVQLLVAYRNTREVIGERDLWVAVQTISEELQRADCDQLPQVALDAVDGLVEADVIEMLAVHGALGTSHRLVEGRVETRSGPVEQLAGDIWGRVECDRSPFWVQRGSASPRQRNWLAAEGAESALVLPLEWANQVVGVLRVGFHAHSRSSSRIESVLSTVGTQVASALTSLHQTETLRHQAEHDQLTNLPNRTRLVQHLAERLADERLTDAGLAVLFFDLDDFKVVNDSLGHEVGDGVLLEAARRLRTQMRPGDVVARFGGDEFVVVCDQLERAEHAADIARRLLDALAEPATTGNHRVPISASVGIAFSDGPDTDPETLLRDADAAMYQAKRTGPGSYRLFSADLRAQVLERLHLEADLRNALRDGELDVHYQPIVDLTTGETREYEALARWHHEVRGVVPPDAFIAVAEESGHIRALGEVILNRACADMRRWIDLGVARPGQRVAVNLSALQLDATLPSMVAEALAGNGLPPSALTLEVTESALVDDPDAVAALERLRHLGVRVSLDDFGTGYSSLSALRDLPVDLIKIDRSFVGRMDEDPQLSALVRGIVELAHALELEVIAEGVEDAGQSRMLAGFGCDLAQGWLYGRPMSTSLVEASLATVRHLRSVDRAATA